MALRAGYYGVKRKIWEAIQATTAENVQNIADIWENNTIAGAKNLIPNDTASATAGGIVFTRNDDGSVSVGAGTANASTNYSLCSDFIKLESGEYILSAGGVKAPYVYLVRKKGESGSPQNPGITTGGGDIKFTVDASEYDLYKFSIWVNNGATYQASTIYPMLRRADDPDPTYASFAMTNQELTASANDQKTAINAIITAATGAADFAAFKTAMGVISPVTRSAAPDERSLDVEVEEPEVIVKKSTRKTTKKTEEEE